MARRDNPADKWSVRGVLGELAELKHQTVAGQSLPAQVALLRAWQSQRLKLTYADLAKKQGYRLALEFFLEDIYAARDFSQRNHDMEQMYHALHRLVPDSVLRPLVLTVDLHLLTESLDARLLDVLVNQLGAMDRITVAQYAEAYRVCQNYAERVRQIDLIFEIGNYLEDIVKMPLSGVLLNVSKAALERAGWGDLMGFLARGYQAFKRLKSPKEFVETIRTRERGILDRIYAGDSDPFGFGDDALSAAL